MIHFRDGSPSDLPFIFNSWLKSCRKSYPDLTSQEYFQMKKMECTEILMHSSVRIACDPEDHNFIIGYVVYKLLDDVCILHWAYVKSVNRRFGIARKLIESAYPNPENMPIIITHKTFLTDKQKDKFIFKPEYRRK